MRPSLKKLRIILANNINVFLVANIISAVLHILLAIYIVDITSWVVPEYINQPAAAVIAIALAPALIFAKSYLTQASEGIKPVIYSTKRLQKQLFILTGTLWTYLSFTILSIFINEPPLMLSINLLLIVCIWYYIVGLLIKYVRAL